MTPKKVAPLVSRDAIHKAAEAFERHAHAEVVALLEPLSRAAPRECPRMILSLLAASFESLGRIDDACALIERWRGDADGGIEPRELLRLVELHCMAGRYDDAIAILESSKQLTVPPLSFESDALRATAFLGRGEIDKVRPLLDNAFRGAEASGSGQSAALAAIRFARLEYRLGSLTEAERWARRSIALLGREQTVRRAEAHRILGVIVSVQYRFREALVYFHEGLDIFRTHRYCRGLIRSYLSLGLTHLDMGEADLCEIYLRKALTLAEEAQDHTSLGMVMSRMGMLALVRGAPSEALEWFRKDLELSERRGPEHGVAYARWHLGRALGALGRTADAIEEIRRAERVFERVGDRINLALASVSRASLQGRRKGDVAEVRRCLEDARRELERCGRIQLLWQVDLAESLLEARTGRIDVAEMAFARTIQPLGASGNRTRAVQAYADFAESIETSEPDRALRYLKEGYRLACSQGQMDWARRFLSRIDEIDERALAEIEVGSDGAGSTAATAARSDLEMVSDRDLVGRSAQLQQIRDIIGKVADTELPVLIQGESGTGKELIARAIHWMSRRRAQPLIVVNCGAIPQELVESELFGHHKGAFTGAVADKDGILERANHGTVLLDEIGDLPPAAQVKLLRYVQYGEIQKVGGMQPKWIDTRIVAATHRDLEREVAAGRFREDLFYRISVFPIHVPPLRERPGDIPLLVRHLLKTHPLFRQRRIRDISRQAMEALRAHPWPGNVRQLEAALLRAAVVARGETLLAADFALPAGARAHEIGADHGGASDAPNAVDALRAALDRTGWRIEKAAALLGVHRNTLRNRMRRLGLPVRSRRLAGATGAHRSSHKARSGANQRR